VEYRSPVSGSSARSVISPAMKGKVALPALRGVQHSQLESLIELFYKWV
jgi:hypothetical protein